MKWFISIVPDFNDMLVEYREMYKKLQSLVTQCCGATLTGI